MSNITYFQVIHGLEGKKYHLEIAKGYDIEPDAGAMLSSELLSLDIEATGVSIIRDEPIGVGLCPVPSYACYVGANEFPREVVLGSDRPVIAHNATYDRSMLLKLGIEVNNFIDTMVAAHMLGEEPLSLEYLAGAKLNMDLPPHPANMATAPFEQVGEMCCKHAIATRQLWDYFEGRLKAYKLDKPFHEVEMPLVPIISDMEIHGAMVDEEELARLGVRFGERMEAIGEALNDIVGRKFNANSPKQVAGYLFDELKLPIKKYTPSGEPSTNSKEVLDHMKKAHPSVGLITAYRQYRKLKSDYADGLLEATVDGRIHTNFNQCGTRTGRWSSSGPNLQNIPMRREEGRQIRKAFIAPPGWVLLRLDWDQLELRILAHYCQDPEMLRVFRAGEDIHDNTAREVFGSSSLRRPAKNLNFMEVYEGGVAKAMELTGMSAGEVRKWKGKMNETYPGIKRWRAGTKREAREAGYVRTFLGRIRYLPDLFETEIAYIREAAEREAVNTRIQGSAADVVKVGMAKLYKELHGYQSQIILQVHDELVIETYSRELKDVIEMCKLTLPFYEMSVPLTVSMEVGANWRDMQEIE